jgi:hypothetical protein
MDRTAHEYLGARGNGCSGREGQSALVYAGCAGPRQGRSLLQVLGIGVTARNFSGTALNGVVWITTLLGKAIMTLGSGGETPSECGAAVRDGRGAMRSSTALSNRELHRCKLTAVNSEPPVNLPLILNFLPDQRNQGYMRLASEECLQSACAENIDEYQSQP